VRRVAAGWALSLLVALAGCGSDPPTGPTTTDLKAERDALVQKMKDKAGRPTAPVTQPGVVSQGDENSFAGVDANYLYDPSGKRDPFRSYRWARQQDIGDENARGPLEQFELEQLQVMAVVWDTNKPRALVSDPEGRAYVVMEGTKVGKNDGLVIHIGDNLVLIKETYVDFAGEQTTKDVELRIRRSQGG
jgi:type IV pilus assembly protein PilP